MCMLVITIIQVQLVVDAIEEKRDIIIVEVHLLVGDVMVESTNTRM